jgi:hypothetical protein
MLLSDLTQKFFATDICFRDAVQKCIIVNIGPSGDIQWARPNKLQAFVKVYSNKTGKVQSGTGVHTISTTTLWIRIPVPVSFINIRHSLLWLRWLLYGRYLTNMSVTRGSVVGWGTMLQAGRSRDRIPMRSLDFFNLPNPSSHTMILGSTQPLTEMSTRYFLGG